MRFQLEAGQFEYPDLRQCAAVLRVHQRIECRRRDVAASDGRHAGTIEQVGGQRRGRRLAVAAGDGDDQRGGHLLAHTGGEQFDFARPSCAGEQQRFAGVALGTPGDRATTFRPDKGVGRERPSQQLGPRRHLLQAPSTFGGLSRESATRTMRALAMQPLGHRQPGLAESDYQNAFAPEFHRS